MTPIDILYYFLPLVHRTPSTRLATGLANWHSKVYEKKFHFFGHPIDSAVVVLIYAHQQSQLRLSKR